MSSGQGTTTPPDALALKRSLSVWSAIGVSVALMAPSMAININPQGTSGLVGRAVPLAFLLATVGVLLIAYTFVRLAQRFSHAGSVYGFVGATLGPRAGSVAGWLNAGTYLFYGVVTSTVAGIFVNDLVRKLGAWPDSPDWMGYLFAWIALAVVWFFASREVRGGTRLLLIVEGLTIALILIVAVITLVKLLVGDVPDGQRFDMSVFTIPSGTDTSTVFLGVVFGFLSFAGFEAAATLGEETKEPLRDIPRAILGTAIFGGVYFVVVTAIEMMGFGTDEKGVEAFTNSSALVGDLSTMYVASWLGDVIIVGAAISAAACCLACMVGASRLIFALSRDGMGPSRLAAIHPERRVPHLSVAACVGMVFLIQLVAWVAFRTMPFDLFLTSGTAGTLILLLAYVLATLGAMKLLFFSGEKLVKVWEVVIPVLGLAVLGYTLFRNVIPWPTGGAIWGPALAIAVLVIVVVAVLARPAAARRAGEKLVAAEGLSR